MSLKINNWYFSFFLFVFFFLIAVKFGTLSNVPTLKIAHRFLSSCDMTGLRQQCWISPRAYISHLLVVIANNDELVLMSDGNLSQPTNQAINIPNVK